MSSENTSKSALAIRNMSVLFTVLMPLAALGTRFELWIFTTGLLLFAVSMAGSMIIQVINAIWLLRKPALGTKSALRWASFIALPPLVVVAIILGGITEGNPPIHNISTDMVDPPQFIAAVAQRGDNSNPLEYSEELAQTQAKAYPDLASIVTTKSPADAFAHALAICAEKGWSVYSQDADAGIIEAVDTTFWFGFKDDIVIRIKARESGSILDMRSVSRVGVSDLGLNASRIRGFITSFKQ